MKLTQFKIIDTSSLIIFRVLFENILVEVYGILVNAILKLHSNSCGNNINLYNDVWVKIFIQFEVLLQPCCFYLQVSNVVNVVLYSHKLLSFSPLSTFYQYPNNITPLDISLSYFIYLSTCILIKYTLLMWD